MKNKPEKIRKENKCAVYIKNRLPLLYRFLKKLQQIVASRVFLNILIIFFALTFVVAGLVIYSWFNEGEENRKLMNEIDKIVPPQSEESLTGLPAESAEEIDEQSLEFLYKDVGALKAQNPDTVGWIKMLDTGVDYPVVKGKDNAFYLNHNFAKEKNDAGWIYADYRCNFPSLSKNTVLFGHLRQDYTMFGSLMFCVQPWWYERPKNMYIWYNTESERMIFKIFSIYITEPDDPYVQVEFSSDKEYADYLYNAAGKNTVPTVSTYVDKSSPTLTLSTCYDGITKRLVIHARLVKVQKYRSVYVGGTGETVPGTTSAVEPIEPTPSPEETPSAPEVSSVPETSSVPEETSSAPEVSSQPETSSVPDTSSDLSSSEEEAP